MAGINYNYVLLAEDDEDDRNLFEEAFKGLNLALELKIVKNGIELLKFLDKPVQQLPQLIFLDINMPLKSGFECLMEIKQNKRLKHLPVVMYSTSSNMGDINYAYQNGAYYYVRKPYSFSELKKIIQKVLVNNWAARLFQPEREKFLIFYPETY